MPSSRKKPAPRSKKKVPLSKPKSPSASANISPRASVADDEGLLNRWLVDGDQGLGIYWRWLDECKDKLWVLGAYGEQGKAKDGRFTAPPRSSCFDLSPPRSAAAHDDGLRQEEPAFRPFTLGETNSFSLTDGYGNVVLRGRLTYAEIGKDKQTELELSYSRRASGRLVSKTLWSSQPSEES